MSYSKQEHSEEYKRGYHCGYTYAMQKAEAKYKNPKRNKNLENLADIPIPMKWLRIEDCDFGEEDVQSYFCSNCYTSFEGYEPFKFCPECGGRATNLGLLKRGDEE